GPGRGPPERSPGVDGAWAGRSCWRGGPGTGPPDRGGTLPGVAPPPGRGRPLPPRRPPPESPPPESDSRSLRATGASTVDEGDFTYSPRSCNLLRTCLLLTPSSFASSCTRALPATALLVSGGRAACPARPRT